MVKQTTINKYINNKYSKLTILSFDRIDGHHYFYRCICECGTIKSIRINHLIQKTTQTCGQCGYNQQQTKINNKGNKYHQLSSGEAALNNLFKRYKLDAKKRNLLFNINREEFKIFTQQNCFYCNKFPSQIINPINGNGKYVYNGIDRVDNNKGLVL